MPGLWKKLPNGTYGLTCEIVVVVLQEIEVGAL